jgi:MSHA biogenesis protein MshI
VREWAVKRMQPGWVAVAPVGATAHVAYVVWAQGCRPALQWVCCTDWADPHVGLRQLRRRQRLQRHRSVALLQRHQYQLLPLDAPEVPRDAWREAVRWQLKDMVDFAIDDAAIDLLEIPADTSQRGRAGLLVAVAPRRELLPLVQAGHDVGPAWTALDVPDTALRNLCALSEQEGRAQALLGLSATGCWLVVTAFGELLLSRQIEASRTQICAHDVDRGRDLWDRIALELQRTLDHCDRLFNRVSVTRLLVGPLAPDDFTAYLGKQLYLPVQGFDLAELVDLTAVPALTDADEQGRYLCAIGAAMRPN